MTTGTIKKVVADRGFGFIAAEDAKEYFFHRGGLDSSLDFDRLRAASASSSTSSRAPRVRAPHTCTPPRTTNGPPNGRPVHCPRAAPGRPVS